MKNYIFFDTCLFSPMYICIIGDILRFSLVYLFQTNKYKLIFYRRHIAT